MAAPALEQVLANVVPGRGQRLQLSEAQRRALDDRDGRIARQVIRASAPPSRWPKRTPKSRGVPKAPTPRAPGRQSRETLGSRIGFPTSGAVIVAMRRLDPIPRRRISHRPAKRRLRATHLKSGLLSPLPWRQAASAAGFGTGRLDEKSESLARRARKDRHVRAV
jgi:hypothetical protein